jgi:hypothetical protein
MVAAWPTAAGRRRPGGARAVRRRAGARPRGPPVPLAAAHRAVGPARARRRARRCARRARCSTRMPTSCVARRSRHASTSSTTLEERAGDVEHRVPQPVAHGSRSRGHRPRGRDRALVAERERALADVARLDAKLANAGFVERAPADVVAKEREKREAASGSSRSSRAARGVRGRGRVSIIGTGAYGRALDALSARGPGGWSRP